MVIRSGSSEVSWEILTACFQYLSRDPKRGLDGKGLTFVDAIGELIHSDSDYGGTLIDLPLYFCDRVAENE